MNGEQNADNTLKIGGDRNTFFQCYAKEGETLELVESKRLADVQLVPFTSAEQWQLSNGQYVLIFYMHETVLPIND